MTVPSWHERVLNALIPPRCGICSAAANGPLCSACLRELNRQPTFGEHRLPGLDFAWSAFEHSGVPRRLVTTAKFRARPGLLDIAIEEMIDRLPPELLERQLLVPVPPDPWRSRRRGFDLAAGLAERLTTLTDSKAVTTLRRTRSGPQAAKSRQERLAARLTIASDGPLPARITLIDDVVTTGATLAACATAARRACAREVRAVTLTRTAGSQKPFRRNHSL